MEGKMSIYYDEEGDYLEIFIEGKSPTYGEDLGDDVTLFKKEETDEVVGVGVLNFRKRTKNLDEIKLNLPFKVNFSSLKI
ncbi:DUF2283 domain-containing protein [Candidatus Pacearchaeota archaeon]|nr:DUF2283 domain-containing protein [Candidatus Pacearchaeota archaeon]